MFRIITSALYNEIKSNEDWLIKLRRELHEHAELSEHEFKTQEKIETVLDTLGIPHQRIAQTGVLALLEGKGSSVDEKIVVGFRADIDALPIVEKSSCKSPSLSRGVMHACGHDAHTAILLGVLKQLKAMENQWSGIVKGFFQPAEETIGGADRMVQAGCMENPKVDYVFGLHVMANLEVGQIETREGKLNAASDMVKLTIKGKSAHGAYPEKGIDAITIASEVVQSINAAMSRRISPLDQAVLSFGQINGGAKDNIICDEVNLSGVFRTTDENTRARLKQILKKLVCATCEANGGEGEIIFSPGYNALVNDVAAAQFIKKIAAEYLGEENVLDKENPSLGVEDFSFFLDQAKGAFYHLGCGNRERGITHGLHSDQFDIDESCLSVGVFLQTKAALTLFENGGLKS